MNLIKKHNLSFQSACESSELKVMSRQRVRLFRRESFRNIHNTNVMTSILELIHKKSVSDSAKDSRLKLETSENLENTAGVDEIETSFSSTDFDGDFIPA